jgi:hypothetical protein
MGVALAVADNTGEARSLALQASHMVKPVTAVAE